MRYFFDSLHVTILPEEGVVDLAVRVAEGRVDEYRFSVEVFREVVVAYGKHPTTWSGPEDLQVKVDAEQGLASLAVRVLPHKREIHRVTKSHFDLMTAQFRSQDRVR